VQHQLFGGERNQRTGAWIARRSGAENDGRERSEGARIGRCRPRNEILYVLALGSGKDGEEQSRGGLASVAGRGDNAQRALTDPATAPFVAEGRAPTAATNDLSGWTPAVGDRAGPDDEKNSRAVVERIVHRDQAV